MDILVRETAVPDPAPQVAVRGQGIGREAVVRLIFGREGSADFAGGPDGFRMEDEDAGQGVRAIHQGRGSFEDFDGMDTGTVHFDTVLVPPLLPLLTEAVADDDDAVEAHAADDGLGDAPAGGDLAHAGLRGDGADDVSAGARGQVGRADHRDRGRHLFHFRVTGQARDHGFLELQVLVKHIRGVRMDFLRPRFRKGEEHHRQDDRQQTGGKYVPFPGHNGDKDTKKKN